MEDNQPNINNEIKPAADTLLVLNIHNNKIEMVKGVDKEGNLQKVPPENKKKMTSSSGSISTTIFSPTSFPTFTGSLKILPISTSSKFRSMMLSIPQRTFRTMSIRHHLKKKKSSRNMKFYPKITTH